MIDITCFLLSTCGRVVKAFDSKSNGISRACSNHVKCVFFGISEFFLFFLVHAKDESTRQQQFALIFFIKDVSVQKLHPMAQETF